MQARDIAIQQLEEAFAAFNRMGEELDSRYRMLEKQVARLTRELAAARSARLRELAEKERLATRLSALMDALPGGVVVLDATGRVKEENPGAVRLLGRSSLGLVWSDVLAFAGAYANPQAGEVLLPNGVRLSLTRDRPGSGEEILLLTDISENHRLHELLNRDKRLAALGEMSARLAHQVRTPLSSAILYLSHLGRGECAAADIQAKILGRLRQIEALVDSMLGFIRGGPVSREAYALKPLLLEAADAARNPFLQAEGALRLELPEEDCLIEGNRQSLFNAVGNLLENALQAAEAAPRVTLALQVGDEHCEISVSDNGRGIDACQREQIFDPFFSTRPNGTGLGLAVTASAVKAHGGEITVSDAPGGGSVFRLRLPRHAVAAPNVSLWGEAPRADMR